MKDFQGPFITSPETTSKLLSAELNKAVLVQQKARVAAANLVVETPLDSLLKPMMYFSDNMIAEQLILQMAAERNWVLDTEVAIGNLQKEAKEDFLRQVKWVDGSGLSRYNLVRPLDLVAVIQGIYQEMPAQRWQSLLPEAGKSGTLKNVKLENPNLRIWAKSGSFSNTYNLSGIVVTPKGKKLAFAVLTNLANQPVSVSKSAVIQFLNQLSAF
jgi:D-alanyl-D-alanine carboxypeptidase/D-alanyl-D-alanine-endopeptidase (penicillin-binding protein 4)